MKLVIIIGPQAVGKMAVGMALAEKTGMRLFHNHMTIELAKDIYGDMNQEAWKLVGQLRKDIFDSVLHSDLEGFIFTYVWAFNLEEEYDYIQNLIDQFASEHIESYLIELEADLEERLLRNKTDLRLQQKPSKRNLEWSENELLNSMEKYRLNSNEGEITHKNYIKINNTKLTPEEVASQIIKVFNL
ncbi:MAG: AAA family ATPase [Clostridia bacterium]|nr:AAA family ATPase [Clostridia bacterium]